ncbi:uncharacterized protein BJX67DRAFT_211437 [Aspergillus lucknowensis]|uniref:Zn(2)-C6 fungal-type domain-containing protein n=1 Tax=Aspergillus lucknowensis TaxID=176173 RepID=A0ABR4M2B8_9EURO
MPVTHPQLHIVFAISALLANHHLLPVYGSIPCSNVSWMLQCSVDSASGPPCSECALHGRECVFDERLDKRRKVAREQTEELLRKTQEERNHARGCLEYLLNAIRYSDRADVDALIDAIRDGATDNQIPMLIAQITHLSPTSYVSDSPEWYVRPDRIADGVPDGVADGVTDNMLDGYGSQP